MKNTLLACSKCGKRKYTKDPWCSSCNAKCFCCGAELPRYHIRDYNVKMCGACHAGEPRPVQK